MVALIFLFLNLIASPFKPKSRLEAENAALRQQLIVLRRKARRKIRTFPRQLPVSSIPPF
jgi:hypothetical protein